MLMNEEQRTVIEANREILASFFVVELVNIIN